MRPWALTISIACQESTVSNIATVVSPTALLIMLFYTLTQQAKPMLGSLLLRICDARNFLLPGQVS